MEKIRSCQICGRRLDTLFEKARDDAKYCSGKCRQKAYRRRQRMGREARNAQNGRYASHEDDIARMERCKSLQNDYLARKSTDKARNTKGPGGLHRASCTSYFGPGT